MRALSRCGHSAEKIKLALNSDFASAKEVKADHDHDHEYLISICHTCYSKLLSLLTTTTVLSSSTTSIDIKLTSSNINKLDS